MGHRGDGYTGPRMTGHCYSIGAAGNLEVGYRRPESRREGFAPAPAIDSVWLHRFRATFATRALWGNVDLRTVQDWMGHTDLASTLRYLKPNRAVVQEKVEAIWA